MKVNYVTKDIMEDVLSKFTEGELFYEEGRIYRNFKRMNQFSIRYLDRPEVASVETKRGYRRLSLSIDGKSVHVFEHRLVFVFHYGIEELMKHQCIDHIDGDKGNNCIDNLRGSSIRDNTYHAESLGNFKRTYGSINGMAKLSSEDVSRIKSLYSSGVSQRDIGSKFNVSQSHVSCIVTGKKRRFG